MPASYMDFGNPMAGLSPDDPRRQSLSDYWSGVIASRQRSRAAAQQEAQQAANSGWVNPASLSVPTVYQGDWNGALGMYAMPGTPEYSAQSGMGNIAGVQSAAPASQQYSMDPNYMQSTMDAYNAANPKTAPALQTQGGPVMGAAPDQGFITWDDILGKTAPGYTPQGYTPPAPAAGSATATNPFLNIGLNAYTQTQQPYNPGYLGDVSKSLWNQATTNLNENVFPGMDSQAIAAGGYGGDRSYLAKGVAADRMNQSVFNAMAPVYQQDYNAWQNRALAGGQGAAGVGTGLEQLDLNQTLGLGGLGVSQYNADTTRQLGLADNETKRYMAEANAAYQAAQAANPQYTNPWAAGIGAAGSLATLWNTLFGTTPKG